MKKLIFVACTVFSCFLGGCGGGYYAPPVQDYQYITSPTGQQMVIVNDNGNQLLVDALIFSRLGYGGCINYYHVHPNCYPRYVPTAYSSWRRQPRGYNPPSYPRPPASPRSGNVVPSYRPTTPPSARPSYRPSGGTTPSYGPSYTPSKSYTPSYRSSSRH